MTVLSRFTLVTATAVVNIFECLLQIGTDLLMTALGGSTVPRRVWRQGIFQSIIETIEPIHERIISVIGTGKRLCRLLCCY